MNNITTTTGKNAPTVSTPATAENMLKLVMDAARDPSVDPGKMAALVDLQMKMMDYQKQEEFNRDKIAALFAMPTIVKNGAITNKAGQVQSRYSKFEDMNRVIKPILERHNLAITFDIGQSATGNLVTVTPILSHRNGHVERGDAMPLAVDTTGSKNATQGAGSAGSYGKRHAMKAMLNIIEEGEDDDGQAAGSNDYDELVTDAQRAASCGIAAYKRWWQHDITEEQRMKLVKNGKHEEMKAEAAKVDNAKS